MRSRLYEKDFQPGNRGFVKPLAVGTLGDQRTGWIVGYTRRRSDGALKTQGSLDVVLLRTGSAVVHLRLADRHERHPTCARSNCVTSDASL